MKNKTCDCKGFDVHFDEHLVYHPDNISLFMKSHKPIYLGEL